MSEKKTLKFCKDCKYMDTETVATPSGLQRIPVCTHDMCRDVITGEPIPAVAARQQLVYCSFEARYFEQKEEHPKPKVIELAKV